MFNSLKRIKSLPKNTLIYCAHEYTKSNLLWALSIEPENKNFVNEIQNENIPSGVSIESASYIEQTDTNLSNETEEDNFNILPDVKEEHTQCSSLTSLARATADLRSMVAEC